MPPPAGPPRRPGYPGSVDAGAAPAEGAEAAPLAALDPDGPLTVRSERVLFRSAGVARQHQAASLVRLDSGRLLLAFLDLAGDRGAHEATLEVRLSNLPARRLYEKYGFRPVGLRPRYYSDDHEDALIMTTEPLDDARMIDRVARLRAELDAAPPPGGPAGVDDPDSTDEDGA